MPAAAGEASTDDNAQGCKRSTIERHLSPEQLNTFYNQLDGAKQLYDFPNVGQIEITNVFLGSGGSAKVILAYKPDQQLYYVIRMPTSSFGNWRGHPNVSHSTPPPDEKLTINPLIEPHTLSKLWAAEEYHANKLVEEGDYRRYVSQKEMRYHLLELQPFLGISLHHWIKNKPESLTADVILEFIRQVGQQLAKQHAKGVYHRDIRPENITLLIEHGIVTATLIDWERAIVPTSSDYTRESFINYPEYKPPEKNQATPYTPPMDIYALGHVIREILLPTSKVSIHSQTKQQLLALASKCQTGAHARPTAQELASFHLEESQYTEDTAATEEVEEVKAAPAARPAAENSPTIAAQPIAMRETEATPADNTYIEADDTAQHGAWYSFFASIPYCPCPLREGVREPLLGPN